MSCLYCGADMHEFSGPGAIYCIICYGKYGPWKCYCVEEAEDECECPPPEAYIRDQKKLEAENSSKY